MLLALGTLVLTLAPVETAPALRAVLGSADGRAPIGNAGCRSAHPGVPFERRRLLLIASFAASGVVAPVGSLALVLGANIGSTLPPLFEAGSAAARRLPFGNLLVRAAGCIVVLPFSR